MIISKENTGFCNNTTNLIDVKTDALSYCSVLESLLSAEKTMNKAQLFISERSHMEPKNEQWLKTVMGTSETFLATSKLKPPRRQWQATPVLLPRKSRGWRSLVGCSPWGRYESDTTEQLHFRALEKETATHSSVLAWRIPGMVEPRWAAVYGDGHEFVRILADSEGQGSLSCCCPWGPVRYD